MATIVHGGGAEDANEKMKVSQIAVGGVGDSCSDAVDTGGTAEKTVYYCLAGYKEFSHHTVYIRLLGSNDNSSWEEIVKYNAVSGPYDTAPSVGSTNKSYRYYRIHCHRQSGGDRVGGMLAVMAE